MNRELPKPGSRQARAERLVWIADLIRYAAFVIIGLGFTLVSTPVIDHTIGHYPGLAAWVPGGLFVAGGVWGLAVRSMRLSLYEMPAIWLNCGALAVYLVLCIWSTVVGGPTGVVGGAYAVAFLALFVRRILELSALTSQPTGR